MPRRALMSLMAVVVVIKNMSGIGHGRSAVIGLSASSRYIHAHTHTRARTHKYDAYNTPEIIINIIIIIIIITRRRGEFIRAGLLVCVCVCAAVGSLSRRTITRVLDPRPSIDLHFHVGVRGTNTLHSQLRPVARDVFSDSFALSLVLLSAHHRSPSTALFLLAR